jgi:protein SCO1
VTRSQAIAVAALALSDASVGHAPSPGTMEVGVELPAHATLPLNLPLQGQDGSTKPLRFWLGAGPGVWVVADYTCKTLCGPVISIVSDALADSGLRPGVAGAGLFWLGILLWLGLMDFVTRT